MSGTHRVEQQADIFETRIFGEDFRKFRFLFHSSFLLYSPCKEMVMTLIHKHSKAGRPYDSAKVFLSAERQIMLQLPLEQTTEPTVLFQSV